MSQLSLRRTLLSTAAAALVVGGSLGFVGAVAGADPTGGNALTAVTSTIPAGSIELNNSSASAQTDCPDDGFAYWHFILAPNNGTFAFTEIHLELAVPPAGPNDLVTFSGAAIVPNGSQLDNVFVAVPAGHTLDDIVIENHQSYAFFTGSGTPTNFTLSHTCEGVVPTTATTSTTTPPTTKPTTTSTSTSTTSTSTTSTSTTSTSTTSTSTSTTSTSTTSTTVPSTTTTAPSTTTTPSVAPTTAAQVLGTVQTQPEAAAVETAGELPFTGSNVGLMVVSGLCVLAGGAALVAIARTGRRTT
jgi:hypothetical protein